jgi:ribonuclease P protein component
MARPAPRAVSCRVVPSSRGNWRSLKSGEFAAVLTTPVLAKSSHFVLHHIAAGLCTASGQADDLVARNLSTAGAPIGVLSVDNLQPKDHWWFGLVVPKRHAPRAVTRNLLKRQMRLLAIGGRHRLPPGQWLIRLRAPFDKGQFVSPASARLRDAARSELEQIFAGVWVQ